MFNTNIKFIKRYKEITIIHTTYLFIKGIEKITLNINFIKRRKEIIKGNTNVKM